MNRIALALPLAALALAAGCAKTEIAAPTDKGVCWHAKLMKDDTIKFNRLADNQKNVETCAASLESMRLRFRALGGAEEIMGAYQGYYIFIQREGVFIGQTLTGSRFPALVRTGDGRLAIPGAMPQQ